MQVLVGSGYKSPESAALAVTKLFPEDERSQKVTLDIGAGTGLVADEV
jgi:predicted TPR repeat methyltransferase